MFEAKSLLSRLSLTKNSMEVQTLISKLLLVKQETFKVKRRNLGQLQKVKDVPTNLCAVDFVTKRFHKFDRG